jgi:hypothetical protein
MTMPFLNAERYYYASGSEKLGGLNFEGEASGVKSFVVSDAAKEFETQLIFSRKADEVCYFPIETISQSEGSFGRSFQGSCILPKWRLYFGKGKGNWKLKINWMIS